MSSRVDWQGDAVLRNVQEAARRAIDETTATAVIPAKASMTLPKHGRVYRRRWLKTKIYYTASAPGEAPARVTGILQGGVQMRPARRIAERLTGFFGVFQGNEQATTNEPGYALALETVLNRPYLRPAADAEFPKLAERIRAWWERLRG